MSQQTASMRERIDAAIARADIAAIVGRAVKLGPGRNPRGKCPFHGSKSDSLAVYPDKRHARCWGCGWHGDAIRFLMDHDGLDFMEALRAVEGEDVATASGHRVHREKSAPRRVEEEPVGSIELGRELWRRSAVDHDAVRTYLRARGVPGALLSDRRLADIRFVALGPVAAWLPSRGPESAAQAPAMVALVRALPESGLPPGPERDLDDWPPLGVHATFLAPDLRGKMERARGDGSRMPARKMCGPVGRGGVWLPGEAFGLPPRAPLFAGEGIETVLSGMALAGRSSPSGAGMALAGRSSPPGAALVGGDADAAWGLALLSLGNLQGAEPRIRKERAIPLHDPRPSAERPPLAFAHAGPVTGLIDADMAPLRGMKDRATGEFRGEPVIERKGGPVVRRTISSAERSQLCATLFVRGWRAAGCPDVRALRPHMGQDFNDLTREGRS